MLVVLASLTGLASTASPRLTLGAVCIATIMVALFGVASTTVTAADHSFLLKVFLLAVVVRVMVAIATYHLLPYGFFAPDEAGYAGIGNELATSGLPNAAEVVRGAHGWYLVNAVLAYFFGLDAPLLARLWNCGIGALVPILCYRVTTSMGTPTAARVAAVLTAFFPSLVLWSSLNLKDTDTHVLILAILLLSLRLQRGWRLRYLLVMAPMLVVLGSFRQYLVFPSVAAVLVAQMVVRRDVFANLFVVVIVGGLLVVPLTLWLPSLVEWSPRVTNVDNLNQFRAGFASGAGSAYLTDASFTGPLQLLAFVPLGLLFFFLGPFPWTPGRSLLQQVAVPEMLLYYALLPLVAIGLWRAFPRNPGRMLPLLTFSGIVAISYSLTLTNFGTLFRFRDQLLLLMLCFAGIGLASLKSRSASLTKAPDSRVAPLTESALPPTRTEPDNAALSSRWSDAE